MESAVPTKNDAAARIPFEVSVPVTHFDFCESTRLSNQNSSGCIFRFDNRRGTIDVDVGDAFDEVSLFVIQIRGLDVAYNNSNTTRHWYISLTVQGCHPI
ncbi:MAG TPA: hypothetical protein VHY56_10230 [Candidatus Binataceae bacterium]|nr:hypothetical protein [Candidatus Binataceae bacterium]